MGEVGQDVPPGRLDRTARNDVWVGPDRLLRGLVPVGEVGERVAPHGGAVGRHAVSQEDGQLKHKPADFATGGGCKLRITTVARTISGIGVGIAHRRRLRGRVITQGSSGRVE